MSAYVVSKAEIDALITAAVRWAADTPGGFRYYWYEGGRAVDTGTATSVGQMLWQANWYHAEGWAEVELRESRDAPTYFYEPLPGDPHPVLILRLLQHYRYQTAGEPQKWLLSEAQGFVNRLQMDAIGRLPGFQDLPWGVGDADRDIFQRPAS